MQFNHQYRKAALIRAPSLAKPSTPAAAAAAAAPARRACWVASVGSDGKQGLPDRPEGQPDSESIAGNTARRQQQPQQEQQQGKAGWGSSWARRPVQPSGSSSSKENDRLKKPVSLFAGSAAKQNNSSTSSSGPASAVGATASAERAKLDPELEASIRQNVDRAAQTLQEMMSEVLNELLIEEASAYVLDEATPSIDLKQAARNAVVKRLEWLDANFLAALNAYMAVPGVASNGELRALLGAIRDEVLDLVSARMPPSVQVLNAALNFSSRAGRASVVTTALGGGSGAVPACDLDSLGAAAAQLVEDMEDQQVVADRVLLARLVLLREELRLRAEQLEAQQTFFRKDTGDDNASQASQPLEAGAAAQSSRMYNLQDQTPRDNSATSNRFFAFHRTNLPARCAAFMKELLVVPERDKRLGLLAKAFQEDWVSEAAFAQGPMQAPGSERPTPSSRSRGLKDVSGTHQDIRHESLDIVRPGRFFSTLLAMQFELEQRVVSLGLIAGDGETTWRVLQQLEAIRLEALIALDRIQGQRPTVIVGGNSDDNKILSDGTSDYELDL